MKFYLGTPEPFWIDKVRIPWFISYKRLTDRTVMFKNTDCIMDSGGFTELTRNGRYTYTENDIAKTVRITGVPYAFCMDWMCEDYVLKKTGLTVQEHQKRTIESYVKLVDLIGDKALPVIQGKTPEDYIEHLEGYKKSISVPGNTLWGLGSVCKRQSTQEIFHIMKAIKEHSPEIKLHGFGVKTTAFKNKWIVDNLWSADSMVWSYKARYEKNINPCICPNKSCQNCMEYALLWRKRYIVFGLKDFFKEAQE